MMYRTLEERISQTITDKGAICLPEIFETEAWEEFKRETILEVQLQILVHMGVK